MPDDRSPTAISLEELTTQALAGSRDAVESLVRAIQHDVHGLALRMLWHPEDAADATQEILIKIVTHLASFRGESAFRTWCFRIACNHLLTTRAGRAEQRAVSFDQIVDSFAHTPSLDEPRAHDGPEDRLFAEEIKIGCTLGILTCLDRPHRLAYIVGEILDLSSEEGADVTGASEVAYRKRLSRARAEMRAFLGARCGIVNEEAACRCADRVAPAIAQGRLDPRKLLFAGHPERPIDAPSILRQARAIEELHATVQLYRSHPDRAAPGDLAASIRALLGARDPSLLSD